jgi:mannose-6-phosphate isomerase class I
MNVVLFASEALLGTRILTHFGKEFPIRFDFLDTMGGGNLSLQVHPLKQYIQTHFGMKYTQDESYYILDASPESVVYLGFKKNIDVQAFERDLASAARGEIRFPDENYIHRFPVKKHDHIAIPSGTIHCSGINTMVLEISATPYIFTFKLWDWGRLGLDGKPRPIHLGHGLQNLQYDRDEDWVNREILSLKKTINEVTEETGLHPTEFIKTWRHTLTHQPITLSTQGSVNMLNLVEGRAAIVESTQGEFAPFEVYYAETFVVPCSVGTYTIRALEPDTICQVIQAFVKEL